MKEKIESSGANAPELRKDTNFFTERKSLNERIELARKLNVEWRSHAKM